MPSLDGHYLLSSSLNFVCSFYLFCLSFLFFTLAAHCLRPFDLSSKPVHKTLRASSHTLEKCKAT